MNLVPLHVYISSGSDWFGCDNVYQLYDKDRLAHIIHFIFISLFLHQDSLLWTIHVKIAFAKVIDLVMCLIFMPLWPSNVLPD